MSYFVRTAIKLALLFAILYPLGIYTYSKYFLNEPSPSFLKDPELEAKISAKVQDLINRLPSPPVAPTKEGIDYESKIKEILYDKSFYDSLLVKFQGAVKIKTESFDKDEDKVSQDSDVADIDEETAAQFYQFHDYLAKTFPLIHSNLKLEKPQGVNLLYTWEGSNSNLKPLFLIAHQDVVPVDPQAALEWDHDPYSAYYDGTHVWGRGSIDCKLLLISELQAVESLLEQGFQPDRTVLLGYGYDEESGGNGAAAINDTLFNRYGPHSIYSLLDEGPIIAKFDNEWFALPATTEKGYINIKVGLSTPGGHSSAPPKHTNIGIVSKLITLIENDDFKPFFTKKNPLMKYLQQFAKVSKSLPEFLRTAMLRAEFDDNSKAIVIEWLKKNPFGLYLIKSSQAVNVIHGGLKSNALPEYTSFIFNSRISTDSSVNETVEHILKRVKVIAEEFDLGINYEDTNLKPSTPKGYFNVTIDLAIESLPVSPSEGPVWDVFAGTLRHLYEDFIFTDNETLHVTPFLMPANTDTKKYTDLTKHIYRFNPARLEISKKWGIHSINEHVPFSAVLDATAFIYEYILNADTAKDE